MNCIFFFPLSDWFVILITCQVGTSHLHVTQYLGTVTKMSPRLSKMGVGLSISGVKGPLTQYSLWFFIKIGTCRLISLFRRVKSKHQGTIKYRKQIQTKGYLIVVFIQLQKYCRLCTRHISKNGTYEKNPAPSTSRVFLISGIYICF